MAIKKDDPDLLKAFADARATLHVFYDIYDEHYENIGIFFGIKVPIVDGDTTAHLWYSYQGKDSKGYLIGEHFELPEELSEHKSIRVKEEDIEDWMINDHGNLWGGFSIRFQRTKTPEEKRAEFDEYSGIKKYINIEF